MMWQRMYLCFSVLCFCASAALGQGIRQVPRRGSVSKASSNAYEREINYGGVEFGQGVSNSRAVTKTNGGVRNGGTTSISRSNAVSRDVDIGGLNIGGTLTRSQTRTNGAVSRGVAYDANIGNLGFGASLSPQNLRNGFGLMPQAGGGVTLGLGLLNLDLSRNAQQNSNALTQAQVNVQGRNSRTRANANSNTQTQNYGGVGVTTTQSRSNAFGRTQVGRTSALTGGVGDNIATNGGFNYYRPQRAALVPGYGQQRLIRRPRREAVLVPESQQAPYVEGNLRRKRQQQLKQQYNNVQRLQQQQQQQQQQQYTNLINSSHRYNYKGNSYGNKTKLESSELDDLNRVTPASAVGAPALGPAAAEQFDVIDGSQRQGRTFSFITDFIDNLTARCVYPCTIDAYRQNRCCEAVVIAPPQSVCCNPGPPPPPPPPPSPICCAIQQYPIIVPQPLPRRRIVVVPTGVPINCCVTCANNNAFFGPPPCVRYGVGGASLGTITGSSASAWSSSTVIGGGAGNIGLDGLGNIGLGGIGNIGGIGGISNIGSNVASNVGNLGGNVVNNIGQRIPIYSPYLPPVFG